MVVKALINEMSAALSMSGKQMGTNSAVMKLERKVYVVICSRLPPNFCVTTGAADAQGATTHTSIASTSTRLFPVSPNSSTSHVNTMAVST